MSPRPGRVEDRDLDARDRAAEDKAEYDAWLEWVQAQDVIEYDDPLKELPRG